MNKLQILEGVLLSFTDDEVEAINMEHNNLGYVRNPVDFHAVRQNQLTILMEAIQATKDVQLSIELLEKTDPMFKSLMEQKRNPN